MNRPLLVAIAFAFAGTAPNGNCVGQDLEGLGFSGMLNLPFANDLELTDEQKFKLERSKEDFSKKMSKELTAINESLRSDPTFDVRKASGEVMKKLNKQRNENVWEIFLPHQQRLIIRQTFWTFVNESTGFHNELSKNYYAEHLKLTGKQKLDLKLEGEKMQKEFSQDLEKLRKKYRRELEQEVLTKKQIQTLGKLMGENIAGTLWYIKF